MKPDDILDAIGNIDEACVKKAKEKKKSHKALWIAVSSFAACLVIALILPSIVMNFSGYGNAEVDDDKSADRELAMAYENAGIYYTDGGKFSIRKNTVPHKPHLSLHFGRRKTASGMR